MHLTERLYHTLKSQGLLGTIASIRKKRLASTDRFRQRVGGCVGLEIGGPSPFFSTFLPIYDCIESLDNCVFANATIWEGEIKQSFEYCPGKRPGRNYIADGSDLRQFAASSYDFVLSCHNLEHIANPVLALNEWIRVITPGGCIVLVLPDYRRTFDHRRSPTPVTHMLEDYAKNIGEDDMTHLDEILAKHDLRRDPVVGTWSNLRERSLKNPQLRCVHHHVFDTRNVQQLLRAVGLEVVVIETAAPFHIASLARVPDHL